LLGLVDDHALLTMTSFATTASSCARWVLSRGMMILVVLQCVSTAAVYAYAAFVARDLPSIDPRMSMLLRHRAEIARRSGLMTLPQLVAWSREHVAGVSA
jgi:hypothetical protein